MFPPLINPLLQSNKFTQLHNNQKSIAVDRVGVTSKKNAKAELRHSILKQISEMEEASRKKGEGDPKAERLISKFNSGKKLTPEELRYLIKNAPGSVDRILRITAEREQNEMMMRLSPTKVDMVQVQSRAIKAIEKSSLSPEEAQVRMSHLQDSVKEYQKSEAYKEKPNTIFDKKNKKKKGLNKSISQPNSILLTAAKKAYLKAEKHN